MKIHKTTFLTLLFATLASVSLLAQVPGMLNYQGRVSVNGTNFTGNGLFKFALVGEAGPGGARHTLWSSDGTSTNGSEPSASVSITAEKGLFSALIGGNGMQPVPPSAFANDAVYLRVWFSSGGANAFEQLSPDQRIAAVGYAMKSTSADSATTVADGSITTAKLADNSITVDKVAPELIDAVLPAEGAVSGYSVLPLGPTVAEPNTKYLMPENGAGILTLPTNPPIGAAIQISGQGTVFANSNQLIGGLWFKADTSRPGQYWQHFVSGDGRTIVSFNPMLQTSGPTNFPSRIRVLKIDGSAPQDFSTPTNSYGDSGPMGRLAISADAQTLFGSFAVADHNTYALHVSTNGAASWEPITLPNSLTNFTRFVSLACSSDGQTLYALAHDPSISTYKVIKSTDRGNSWITIESIPSEYSLAGSSPTGSPLSVSGNGSTVMIPVGPMHSQPNSLLVSTNGGDSWLVANPTNGMTNISGWRPERAVLAGGDGQIAIPARLSYAIAGNSETVTLLVSTNFGNSWSSSWDERFRVSPPPPDFHLASSQSGTSLYMLGSSYTQGFGTQNLSVLISSDLGKSWASVFTTESMTPTYAERANMLFVSDATGFQVAVVRSVSPATEPGNSGIYLSAGNKLRLGAPDASAELVYRGDGRWSILSSRNASSSIGMPATQAP
jgi:hypothetical protein